MKVAKEKVWEDSKGNLVPDGHEDAQFLVAAKGSNVADAKLERYDGVSKFFKDAVFDKDGAQVTEDKAVAGPEVMTYHMVKDHGAPAPVNREESMPMRQRTPAAAAKKTSAKKTAAEKSGK